jgi:hypothetical protein
MQKQTSERLLALWRSQPERQFDGIVTVGTEPADCVNHIQHLNLTVRRTFALTRTLAVSGPARAFLLLHAQDWVVKIEEDQAVRTVR